MFYKIYVEPPIFNRDENTQAYFSKNDGLRTEELSIFWCRACAFNRSDYVSHQ